MMRVYSAALLLVFYHYYQQEHQMFFTFAEGCETALDCRLNGECVTTNPAANSVSNRDRDRRHSDNHDDSDHAENRSTSPSSPSSVRSGSCVCDKGWTGESCGNLSLGVPVVAYGTGSALSVNVSAWGGGPPVSNGTHYHLFVSEMEHNCGMGTWSHQSTAVHAVSESLEGPYRRVELVKGPWVHNTLYAYSQKDQMHLIYSIGDGSSPDSCNHPITNCTGGVTKGANGLHPPTPWPEPASTCPAVHTTSVHHSKSLDGPWQTVHLEFHGNPKPQLADADASAHTYTHTYTRTSGSANANMGGASFGTSNPAPLVLENGTVLLVTRGKDAVDGRWQHNLWLWRAESWNSTYELVLLDGEDGAINVDNVHCCSTEDPVIWKGRRGYHMILHSHPRLTHAWSEDAMHWHWSADLTGPEPSAGGGDHERPRVVVDANGDLQWLFVSTLVSQDRNDASALLAFPVV